MELPQHSRVAPLTVKALLAHKTAPFYSVAADAMLAEALKTMAEHDVGALVVLDGRQVAGIFSERDYVRWSFLGFGKADASRVRDAMGASIDFATPAQGVHECLTLMHEKRLRYLPVVEGGKPLGLLTHDDLLQAVLAYYEHVFQANELDQRILFLPGTYSC